MLVLVMVGLSYSQNVVATETDKSTILDIDYSTLVSRAYLTYEKPVPYREAGLPMGNGRMGSMVWTSPSALRFQINRVDVYANNKDTNSFHQRHKDYCGGWAAGFSGSRSL